MAQEARYRLYRVPSGAMEPILRAGETLTFDLYWQNDTAHQAGPPHFQEIVLFLMPAESIEVAKRVLGLPGDTLQMRAGRLSRNGHELDEPYVQHTKPAFIGDSMDFPGMRTWQLPFLVSTSPAGYAPDLQNWGPLVVPDTAVAVLGDNRDESYDTRYIGFIPLRLLIGRLLRVWDPVNGVLRWSRDTTVH